jgi:Fur family ferric uptake transcriptional regulator
MNSAQTTEVQARLLLKQNGLRATSQRLAVLMVLHQQRSPVTHEDVMGMLRGTFDKASVWRVLSDLTNVGILRRMDLGDRVWRYELYQAHDQSVDDHPHFLCEVCSEVMCLPPLEVRSTDGVVPAQLRNAHFHIRITGTCERCVPAA